MFKRSRGSFLATERWMLAICVAFLASSVILPCGGAFALPRQGGQTASYTVPLAKLAAHEHAHSADNARTSPSGSSYCVEILSLIPFKAKATSRPPTAEFYIAIANHNSPIFQSAPAAQIVARPLVTPPQFFLKTSRLLI